ncbi:MAG: 30S ribosome-binding factor RbfA [Chloroflexota bacterium]
MPSGIRLKRISDQVKQILSITLQSRIGDPRLAGIFITDVEVDRELEYANIYVSAIEGQDRAQEAIAALNNARGFLKFELAQEIDLRVIPKLKFYWDETPEKADRIDTLLAQIRGDLPEADIEDGDEDV